MTKAFDWKRFWGSRDGSINLSDRGFLSDPDGEWSKYLNPGLVTFEHLAGRRCIRKGCWYTWWWSGFAVRCLARRTGNREELDAATGKLSSREFYEGRGKAGLLGPSFV